MRKYFLPSLFTLALVFVFQAGFGQNVILDYFSASPDGSDILVTWELTDQEGITNYKLLRKIEGEGSYSFIAHISPEADGRYEFLDITLFKDNAKNVSYKLQINRGGDLFTFLTQTVHNPTSVQRTWGSIKNMFR